jgi:hypothetical protein
LHPRGLEVVTVSLELSGPEASRPYIEAASPEHPSLLDAGHRMDALFGVVNIPNVVWIDENGMIVRPAEPGWPPRVEGASGMAQLQDAMRSLPPVSRAKTAPEPPADATPQRQLLASGQDRRAYPDAIRDWVAKGAASRFALTPQEVVARSQPRDVGLSAGAAHFELASHLWRLGAHPEATAHFNESHRLQPHNWTYKRQAWSLVSHERVGGQVGRFVQGPLEGEEDNWPFASDFRSDFALLGEGEYYPKTMEVGDALGQ